MPTTTFPSLGGRQMRATTITLDRDIIRLHALLERLDLREQELCCVEGCTHTYPHEMHELEAA